MRRARDIFFRMMFRIDQRAAQRLVDRGPSGRPLVLFWDRVSSTAFRLRGAWRERRRAELAGARSVEECIAAAQRVLSINQKRPEIVGFLEWARAIAPRRLCEIGVEGGGTHLLLKHAFSSAELTIGVDLYVRHKDHLTHFSPGEQRSVFIDGSSYAPATVEKVKETLGGEPLDLLLIDGDHSFRGASQDFELYRHLVRRGGIIAFHDIVDDSVNRTGYHTGSYVGGVPDLWRQLRGQYRQSKEFVGSWSQDGYGIGAIIYDPDVAPRLQATAT